MANESSSEELNEWSVLAIGREGDVVVTVLETSDARHPRFSIEIKGGQWELCCALKSIDELRRLAAIQDYPNDQLVFGDLHGIPVSFLWKDPVHRLLVLALGPIRGEWFELSSDGCVTNDVLLAIQDALHDFPNE